MVLVSRKQNKEAYSPVLKPCVVAVLRDSVCAVVIAARQAVWCICMYHMLVRLSVCLNHMKGTIIIIIKNEWKSVKNKRYAICKTSQ